MSSTTLRIENETADPVDVYFTVAVASGNVTVADLPFLTPVPGNPNQGTFRLPAHERREFAPPAGTTLIGNLCFGGPPINCPTPAFPTAVNLFEFALDLESGMETIDISCVAGANAFLKVRLHGGGGWNAGSTEPSVTAFHNAAVGGNTGLVGVYPVSCDVCTASAKPPLCDPAVPAEQPQAAAICNVQRDASQSGGVVAVAFAGFT